MVFFVVVLLMSSQSTLAMFVGVVALRYNIMECRNSHKHSQTFDELTDVQSAGYLIVFSVYNS